MGTSESSVTQERVEELLAEWPDDPTQVAQKVIDKYGPPDEATPSRLIWFNNGPWKRSVMHREGTPHNFPMEHTDYFKQVIDYGVPPDKYDALGTFDGSVYVDRTKGELAATCHFEAANFLALNLAHEVITDEQSVDEARQIYAETIAKKQAGGSPAYTQGFQFDLPQGDQRDPDETILTQEMKQNAQQQVQGAESE